MNQQSTSTRFKGVCFIVIGITIAFFGVVLDAYLRARHYANIPPRGPGGPILLGTGGLLFFFPLGVMLLILGIFLVVHSYKQWPRVQELLDR